MMLKMSNVQGQCCFQDKGTEVESQREVVTIRELLLVPVQHCVQAGQNVLNDPQEDELNGNQPR